MPRRSKMLGHLVEMGEHSAVDRALLARRLDELGDDGVEDRGDAAAGVLRQDHEVAGDAVLAREVEEAARLHARQRPRRAIGSAGEERADDLQRVEVDRGAAGAPPWIADRAPACAGRWRRGAWSPASGPRPSQSGSHAVRARRRSRATMASAVSRHSASVASHWRSPRADRGRAAEHVLFEHEEGEMRNGVALEDQRPRAAVDADDAPRRKVLLVAVGDDVAGPDLVERHRLDLDTSSPSTRKGSMVAPWKT